MSTYVEHPASSEEVRANILAAESLGKSCPSCGEPTKAVAQHKQATRQEPCTFLGVQLLCECAGNAMTGLGSVAFIPNA